MGWLHRLLAGSPPHDPTADWPVGEVAAPDVSLASGEIGRLKFGCVLDTARAFGRPDSARHLNKNYLELLYVRAGFQIDFENGKLVYVAFLVGPDPSRPQPAGLDVQYCTARLRGGVRFSGSTRRNDLERTFGPPTSVDAVDPDDVILSFSSRGLRQEFEMNETGRLKRWNIFPEEEVSP